MKQETPRVINLASTFDALVQWYHDELIVKQNAPGFLIGLSGTDSLVAFCATYKALEKAGKAHRMMGVHFAPSEDFLYDHPEAEVHLWFQNEVVPWLKQYAPQANIVIDTSIDWRCDGLRWGALMDMSVVSNDRRRMMRPPEEQYWVVGTRNLTEHVLLNYSNASTAVSLQPIIHLWKSEILQLSEHLNIPKIAVAKSCETDCICGREALAAKHIKEIDWLLMNSFGEVSYNFITNNIPADLMGPLQRYINAQMAKNGFKRKVPHIPPADIIKSAMVSEPLESLVEAFETKTLKLNEFNHYKHLAIAWFYLKRLPLEGSIDRYSRYLQFLLDANNQSRRFSLDITQKYFARLNEAMKLNPTETFEELVEKCPEILSKISA